MKKLTVFLMLVLVSLGLSAKKVKFAVDMTGQAINSTGVHVSGDFQAAAGYAGGDWQPNTTIMVNQAGTGIYYVIVDIPAKAKYEYKFLNGDQWYDVEFVPEPSRVGYNYNDNRWIYVDSVANDTTLVGPVLFGGNAPAGKNLLRLKVDMQLESSIDPAGVHVAGDFQGWDPAATPLYSFEGTVYEVIVFVDSLAQGVQYRYLNGDLASQYESVPGWCSTGSNRSINVNSDTMVAAVCYSGCGDCSAQGIAESAGEERFVVYPNPSSGLVTVEFNDFSSRYRVFLTNAMGKVLPETGFTAARSVVLGGNDLPEGLYFVTVTDRSGFSRNQKLVIIK